MTTFSVNGTTFTYDPLFSLYSKFDPGLKLPTIKIAQIFDENAVEKTSPEFVNRAAPASDRGVTSLRVTLVTSATVRVDLVNAIGSSSLGATSKNEREFTVPSAQKPTRKSSSLPPPYLKYNIVNEPSTYVSEMKKFTAQGKHEEALNVYNQWTYLGNTPTLQIMNAAIDAAISRLSTDVRDNLQLALRFSEEMEKYNIKRNDETVVLLLQGCADACDIEEGERVYRHSSYDLPPSLLTNNALLGVYARSVSQKDPMRFEKVKRAEKFYRALQERDVITENALLQVYINGFYIPKAQSHLFKMFRFGILDDRTFLIIVPFENSRERLRFYWHKSLMVCNEPNPLVLSVFEKRFVEKNDAEYLKIVKACSSRLLIK